jgi:hypothetical protein
MARRISPLAMRRYRSARERLSGLLSLAVLLGAGAACTPVGGEGPTPSPSDSYGHSGAHMLTFEFDDAAGGWLADVTDFSQETRPDDVLVEHGASPPGLEPVRTDFLHVAATNRSDDLFLYVRRQVDGLEPDTDYEASFAVTFASDAPSGCFGVGGAPGESVWVKVGASPEEPVPVEVDGDVRLSVDKGNQAEGGRSAGVAGVVANGIPCEEALAQPEPPYALVTLDHTLEEPVTTTDRGTLWLFVGTDSGFESRTSIYYDRLVVTLRPVLS